MTTMLSIVVALAQAEAGIVFTETRDRFWLPDAAEALEGGDHQDKVHEQTGAQRDEQKDAKTTQPAIRCHTKERNCRRTAARTSTFTAAANLSSVAASAPEIKSVIR